MERDASCLLHSCLIDEFQWDESSGSLSKFSVYAYVETKVIWETVMLVEFAVAMAMEHDGAMRLLVPCHHRIMAEGQLQILRQERAGGRLDGQIAHVKKLHCPTVSQSETYIHLVFLLRRNSYKSRYCGILKPIWRPRLRVHANLISESPNFW